jgi:hypothetical protein
MAVTKFQHNNCLTKEQIDLGRKMAMRDGLSFSDFVGQLINKEAEHRGLRTINGY